MTVAGSVCYIFSFSSPCKDTNLCFFFFPSSSASIWFFSFWSLVGVELLVAFRWCGGGWWTVELLWGAAVAPLLSMQRREPLFSFFLLIDTPFLVVALWQRWRGKPTVVLLFPSFFLCNFLSPSLCFFRSFQKISHPLFSPSPFFLSFPFCSPPVFSSSPLSFLPVSFFFSPFSLCPWCSVLPLAFIARGRKCSFGNSRVHHDDEEYQPQDAPPDWKRFHYHCQHLLPLMPQLLCLRRQWIVL